MIPRPEERSKQGDTEERRPGAGVPPPTLAPTPTGIVEASLPEDKSRSGPGFPKQDTPKSSPTDRALDAVSQPMAQAAKSTGQRADPSRTAALYLVAAKDVGPSLKPKLVTKFMDVADNIVSGKTVMVDATDDTIALAKLMAEQGIRVYDTTGRVSPKSSVILEATVADAEALLGE